MRIREEAAIMLLILLRRNPGEVSASLTLLHSKPEGKKESFKQGNRVREDPPPPPSPLSKRHIRKIGIPGDKFF
jgi:hypothetical protein